uniref:Uncharacterized protein n=1 Tax=Octopus bimaculoides TaxID=37653 RepID=A0A0L8GUY6_OCTBM
MEDSPSPQDTLSQIWMLYTAKNEQKYFEDYAYHFLDIYKNVLKSEFHDSSNADIQQLN